MLGAGKRSRGKLGPRERGTCQVPRTWMCALVCGYVIIIPYILISMRSWATSGNINVDIGESSGSWKAQYEALEMRSSQTQAQLSHELASLRSMGASSKGAAVTVTASAPAAASASAAAALLVSPAHVGKVIGVGVTVLNDGPFFDGAAVLQESVLAMKSSYPIEFFALCHPNAKKSQKHLAELGFKIIEREEPVKWPDGFTGASDWYKEEVHKNGCCGELEFLKLEAYTLTQYHRVLLLDMDTLIVKSLVYTPDPDMSGAGVAAPMFQGGFMLLKPSREVFDAFVGIARKGDFRPGSGWGGKNVGWGYGGATIQGILPYYYTFVAPGTSHMLDACLYNSMYSNPCRDDALWPRVKSVHFTNCQKPWKCNPLPNELCANFHKEWWKHRKALEIKHGWPVTPQCGRGVKYNFLLPMD